MVLAFGWWAYHLWEINERLYQSEIQNLEYKYSRNNSGLNMTRLQGTEEYAKIEKARNSGKRMIISEGLFFTLCLAFGLWVINRSANREVALAKQRRNFLLSITHELKSPIAAVKLVFETALKRALSDSQKEKLFGNGLKDANRLQKLVEDLLLAARLEDSWQPHPEPMNVETVAAECVETLKIRFPDANIKILQNPHLTPVSVDRPGIYAIINNLLENALKYSPGGSLIEFHAENLINGKCRITIADQGPGIEDAEKLKVFDKFYRVGNEETRANTGTGLGLYVVNQVLTAHKGSITLTDNKPQGSIFTLTI